MGSVPVKPVFLTVAFLLLASCCRCPPGSLLGPVGTPPSTAAPDPTSRPQVLKGWLPEYDAFIQAEMRKYPALPRIASSRLLSFCPGFASIDDKAQFYADLLWSISAAESDWHRALIFLETELEGVVNPVDPITGHQVRSEGLLQLSYQDTRNYAASEACPFDWPADEPAATIDYASGAEHGDGSRSIHDAYKNLGCGLFIVNALLTRRYPTARFEAALQSYWAVMDPARPGYRIMRANLTSRQPACR
jgi:hypothetical protein